MVLSQSFDILFQFAMVYWVPDAIGGHNLAYLSTCGVGYSNILFGVLMLFAFTGDTYTSYFGFRFRKICVPVSLLVLTSVAVPDSSFTGHFFGIIAALVIKFGGFLTFRFLPQLEWLVAFESGTCTTAFSAKFMFYSVQDCIRSDFSCVILPCLLKTKIATLQQMREQRARMANGT
jgi:hypothetical protein